MKILAIKDNYDNEIELNNRYVHSKDSNTIQVEKELLNKYSSNTLHILYKVPPILLNENLDNQQIVDLPVELIEVLILGMAVKAHGMGALTNDPRTGTSYVQNPYIDRYELAIQKAINYGYLPQENVKTDVSRKGFI